MIPERANGEGATGLGSLALALRNTGILVSALPVVYGLSLVSLAYSARVLGPQSFGIVRLATAIASYFLVLGELGLPILGARGTAAGAHERLLWIDRILTARMAVSLVAMLMLATMALLAPFSEALRGPLLICALVIPATGLSLRWFFQGSERMSVAAAADTISSVAGLGLLVALVHSPEDINPATATALGAALASGVFLAVLYRRRAPRWPRPMPRLALPTVRMALPLGLSAILISVYYNLDAVLLGVMRTPEEVGYYGGAIRLMLAVLMIPWTLFAALLPTLSRLFAADRRAYDIVLRHALRITCFAAVPLAVGGVMVGGSIVSAFLGSAYANASTAFSILMLNAAVIFVSGIYGTGLLAAGGERSYLRAVGFGAGTNLVLNLLLIPLTGIEGAAIARLAAEVAVFGALLYYAQRLTSGGMVDSLVAPVAASLAMALAIWLTRSLGPLVQIVVGPGVYLAAALAMDRRYLRDIRSMAAGLRSSPGS